MTAGIGEILAMILLTAVSLLLLFVIARKWNPSFVRVHRVTRNAPAQATSAPSATVVIWYKRPVFVGVAVLGAFIILALLIITWQYIEPSTQAISLILGMIVIAILAILGIMGKAGRVGKIALGLVVLSFVLFGARTPEVLERLQKSASERVLDGKQQYSPSQEPLRAGSQSVPFTQQQEVQMTWKESGKDDYLPVGIWSETLYLKCKIVFGPGNGIEYVIRYRFPDSDWREHVPGTHVAGNQIQIKNLVPRRSASATLHCA